MTEQQLVEALEAKGFSEIAVTEKPGQVRAMYRGRDGEFHAHAVVATGPGAYRTIAEWAR